MLKRLPLLILIILLFLMFFKEKSFNEKSIKIGTSLPYSGIIETWGKAVVSGADSYFQHVNESNLLGTKKIDFIVYDDKYEPDITLENLNKLTNIDDVYTLFGFVGTPTVKNILPFLESEKIPFIAPFTGASFLRDSKKENFINFRSSYSQEIESLVEYLNKKRNLNRFAVFYQNDDYGEEGYMSLLSSLKKRDLTLAAEGSYKRNTISINHAFHEIKNSEPEVIIMVGAYKANAQFIKKAKQDSKFKNTIFCNISFGDANAMVKELEYLQTNTHNLLFTQVVPNYTDSSIQVIKEYQELMQKYYPKQELGFISLEAFLASKVLISSIQRIKGDLTRSKLLVSIKKTPKNLLKGIPINFKNSQLLNKTYIFKYENSSFKEIEQ